MGYKVPGDEVYLFNLSFGRNVQHTMVHLGVYFFFGGGARRMIQHSAFSPFGLSTKIKDFGNCPRELSSCIVIIMYQPSP